MKLLILLLATLNLAFAQQIDILIEGGDAASLTKAISKIVNPQIDGLRKIYYFRTKSGGLSINCFSELSGAIEHKRSCTISLTDSALSDSDLKIIESKKYKNELTIRIVDDELKNRIGSALSFLPFQSIKKTDLTNLENKVVGSRPVLRVTCLKTEMQVPCDIQIIF